MTTGSLLLETNEKISRMTPSSKGRFWRMSVAMRRRADTLAPWNPSILKQMVKVGQRRYADFSPDVRLIVDGALARSARLGLRG